jgi:hypothetical protein
MSSSSRSWLWLAAIALFGFVCLPLLALLAHVDDWIGGRMFPFLFVMHTDATTGYGAGVPLTDYPILATVAQWLALGAASSALLRSGLVRRPLLASLIVVAVSVACTAVAVGALSLYVDHWKT